MRTPAELATLDASCAAGIPQVHTAGAYPELLDAAAPATLVADPDPGERARKAATVAAGVLGDAPVRWSYAGAARGPGLRGGSFTAAGGARVRLRFRSVRFVRDATVSGTGSWRPADGEHRGSLLVSAPGQAGVRVELSWTQRSRIATARIGTATLALPAP